MHVDPAQQDPVLERLANEQSAWFARLEVAGTLDMSAPGAWGDKSLRDLLVHLNFWQDYKNARLQAGLMGTTAPRPWPRDIDAIDDEDDQVEAINVWAEEQAAGITGVEAIAESRRLWNEQFATIERMSSELRKDPGAYPMFEGQSLADAVLSGWFFEHYLDEHKAELDRLSM